MTKNKYLTKQQLLKELEKRLSDFTDDEIGRLLELTLMNIPNHFKEKLLQLDPQRANDFMKESMQEIENKKSDKLVEKIKKNLR
jgi:predicted transcriptional regulator